jgi:hypothetical protein
LKIWEIIFCFWANYFVGHFSGYFEGASTFLTPKLSRAHQKSLGPLKISLEIAHKVISPQKIIPRIFKISATLIVKKFAAAFQTVNRTATFMLRSELSKKTQI